MPDPSQSECENRMYISATIEKDKNTETYIYIYLSPSHPSQLLHILLLILLRLLQFISSPFLHSPLAHFSSLSYYKYIYIHTYSCTYNSNIYIHIYVDETLLDFRIYKQEGWSEEVYIEKYVSVKRGWRIQL